MQRSRPHKPDRAGPFAGLVFLLGALLPSLARAADPSQDPVADVVAELLTRARDGSLDAAWIEAHIQPRPIGWTNTARTAWMHALAPDGPLTLALQKAGGIVYVSREEGPVRVVVEGSPLLSFLVDTTQTPTIVGVEPTTCGACDERTRFVRDLLADVRRRGAIGQRLNVTMELDVKAWLDEHHELDDFHWAAGLDRWLHTDARVAERLAEATVLGRDGDVVRLRYADGVEDTWRVVWRAPGGWRIDYAGLSPESALAFSDSDADAWRKDQTAADVTLDTWRPTWRTLADGAGRVIGQGAVGAAYDTWTSTVVMAVVSTDRSASALFRVDPFSGVVLGRTPLPLFDEDAAYPAGEWYRRWQFALAPDGQHAAVVTPDGVLVSDLATGTTTRLAKHPSRVTALAFAPDGTLVEGLSDARLVWGSDTWAFGDAGPVLAIHADSRQVSVVTARGDVWQVDRKTGHNERRWTACGGKVTDAAFRERDGSWLVSCAPGAAHTHEVVPWFYGDVYAWAGTARGGAGTAWTGDGNHYAIPGPDGVGVEVWDDLHDRAEVRLGRVALRQVAFDIGGEHLLGLREDGDVVWWDLVAARRLHFLAVREDLDGSAP